MLLGPLCVLWVRSYIKVPFPTPVPISMGDMLVHTDSVSVWSVDGRMKFQFNHHSVDLRYLWIGLGLSVIPAGAVVGSFVRALRAVRGERRILRGACPGCGYDLRATPARCPECGTPATSKATLCAIL